MKLDGNDLSEFDSVLSEAGFLFDKKTNEFIIEIRKKLVFLYVYDSGTINESGDERSKLIKQKYEHTTELLDSYQKLVEMMRPFMDLSRVRL